jgi:hypothetical protein
MISGINEWTVFIHTHRIKLKVVFPMYFQQLFRQTLNQNMKQPSNFQLKPIFLKMGLVKSILEWILLKTKINFRVGTHPKP